MKIIIDTNFLLIPVSMKVDIFSQFKEVAPDVELYVVAETIEELNKIMGDKEQKAKHRDAAKLALQLIEQHKVNIIKPIGKRDRFKNTDQIILERAKQGKFVVATQDKEFRKGLKEEGIPVIILRQKKYLKRI